MDYQSLKTSVFQLKMRLFFPKMVAYYHQLQNQQNMSVDQIEHLNWNKRKALLCYAYKNVPYYQLKYKSIGLHPNDIKNPEDYSLVPILTREEIRAHFDQIKASDINEKDVYLATTGGTTGEPLKVLRDKRIPEHPMSWRLREWWGLKVGVNEGIVLRDTNLSRKARLLNAISWYPAKRVRLDASAMTPESMEQFIDHFNKIQPPLVWGYVGGIDHLASYIEESDLFVASPKAIWSTAAPLSEIQRQRIERVFNAPVYEQYGCCEVFFLAAQCSVKDKMHRFHDIRHIEVVDEQGYLLGSGTEGDILITDLENYAFPIIRYFNGDRGKLISGSCACGINLPLMDKVKGRQSDMVYLPDGSSMSGEYLTTLFDDFPDAVKAFQVRQASDYSIKLFYVPSGNINQLNHVLEVVRKTLEVKINNQVKLSIQATEQIEHDKGKLRFIISDLKRE